MSTPARRARAGIPPPLPINSGYPQFVDALQGLDLSNEGWKSGTAAARKEYLEWTEPRPMPGKLQSRRRLVRWLSDRLPEDAVIAGGAGNSAGWLHRHFRYKGFRTQLGPTNGSLGYGYPGGGRGKARFTARVPSCFCGDGDF